VALEQHIRELSGILKREIQSFRSVHELLVLEEKSLIDSDSSALAEVLEKMEDVFSSIACLEKSRTEVLAKIADETNTDARDFTIASIAEMADKPLGKELVEAGHILSQLNKDIQRKKLSNTMLINQSILLVESDIRILINALNSRQANDTRYNPKSKSGSISHGVCIDQRI